MEIINSSSSVSTQDSTQGLVPGEKLPLTVTIITLNEQDRLQKALESASFAAEIIVVDSGSNDKTVEIAQSFGAKVFTHSWKGYGQQKNYAHSKASYPWVLNIDADERISPDLQREIHQIVQNPFNSGAASGYRIPRKTFYLNRWITHGGWYPNYLVRLCRKDQGKWTEPPVHEELLIDGKVMTIQSDLYHETFRSIHDQVTTNLKYAKLGAERILESGRKVYWFHLILKPLGKWIETYLLKRGFLDGMAGWIISMNAAHSIFLKYAFVWEKQRYENSTCRQ